MKANPYKGDWYYQVQADLQKFGIVMNEQEIKETDLPTFKKTIKHLCGMHSLRRCKQ